MNKLIFLSAQHLTTYYLWQIQICARNLASKGIEKEKIHILFATREGKELSAEEKILIHSVEQLANVFYYNDDRTERNYKSSVRPQIIAKHFSQYPQLEKEIIFYHDCDIFFRELPPLLKQALHDTWYVSDTAGYLDSSYIKSYIGENYFKQMCELVGIEEKRVIEQDANCGGAQYIMTNATAAFWQKVERDSEAIYKFLQQINRQNHIRNALNEESFQYGKGIQSWCADMWAVLWNALIFGHTVKTHDDLNFCWPKNSITAWNGNYILHNAGVEQYEAEKYFYKGNYVYHTPFYESFNYVDKQSCSFVYAEAVKDIAKDQKSIPLKDFSFLIPVMIDSEDRMDNLLTAVRYLQKHFDTNIIVMEYGKVQKVNPAILSPNVKLKFVQGQDEMFHRSYFNNRMIDMAGTPFISIYDTDVILPVRQILDAAQLLRNNEADMVYPYYGYFVSMDKLSSVVFSKFLEDRFFEENNEKFIVSSRRSVGGCVMLNRESFRNAGKENERFTSWGPEDIERYIRMKILGYKIKRVAGPLYHMHHERGKNSGYRDPEKYIAFIEEYRKVFNMKKKELEEYVSTW